MHCILSYFYQNTYLHAPIGNLALHFTHHLSGATFGGLMGGEPLELTSSRSREFVLPTRDTAVLREDNQSTSLLNPHL